MVSKLNNAETNYTALYENTIFPKIAEGKAILFLGAGASVTEFKYLSSQIIDYYSKKINVDFGTGDIIEFVDTLVANENYSRADFDTYVFKMVDKLQPAPMHRTIAKIPWMEVITTNFDTLIERAFEELKKVNKQNYDIKVIRDINGANYRPLNNEFRYVKLHGCASSRDQYPFVFSTKDFNQCNEFYKAVLSNLKNLSPEIIFISIGHSYSDPFGKLVLDKFDQNARAGKRWIYNIDPFVSNERLPYFNQKKVHIIQTTGKDFFEKYENWYQEKEETYLQRAGVKFFDKQDTKVNIPSYLASRLGTNLKPLSKKFHTGYIDAEDFYRGTDPSFDAIIKGLDVIRENFQKSSVNKINEAINNEKVSVPIIFFKGTFGAGKSTSLYRFVSEAKQVSDWESVAFEAIDPERLRGEDLRQLFLITKAKIIFIVVEKVETDSAYRSLRFLQAELLKEQFSELKPIILTSIRENILERFKSNNPISDSYEIRLEEKLEPDEVEDLITKLEKCGLISFPDAQTRRNKVNHIIESKEEDILVILLNLVEDGKHQQILRNAFRQLSPEGQKVLLYTSLVNQHQIDMPVGLIRAILGVDWDLMGSKILREDFLGFVNEIKKVQTGVEPDLYLKIRHRRIAEQFVDINFPTNSEKFDVYTEVLKKLTPNPQMATFTIDILKSVRYKNELTKTQIDKLFDYADNILHSEPHFVIHYSMNLARRNSKKELEKAIDKVKFVMGVHNALQNHRLIHRRAVLAFQMAKIIFSQSGVEREPEIENYLREAIDFFNRKLNLNPDSHYSYYNYIQCEIWMIDNLKDGEDIELRRRLKVERLFRQSEQLVKEKVHNLEKLKSKYYGNLNNPAKRREYLSFLDDLENSTNGKALALALKYYFYKAQNDENSAEALIPKLEVFQENEDISLILFHHYGNNLHNPNFRQVFVEFIKSHPEFEETQPVYYHFYSSIRNGYDRLFQRATDNIKMLREKYRIFNTNLHQIWLNSHNAEPKRFEAQIVKKYSRLWASIIELNRRFPLRYGTIDKEIKIGDYVEVELNFRPTGIEAQIKRILESDE